VWWAWVWEREWVREWVMRWERVWVRGTERVRGWLLGCKS
jgi:hypothetical protein